MSAPAKFAVLIACVIALVYVTFKLILPLIALYFGGVGIEFPLPDWLFKAFPRFAIYIFVVGSPSLALALLAAIVWLIRLRPHSR